MSTREDLLTLLREAPSLEEFQRRVVPWEEKELLKRLALVSGFDAPLVSELTLHGAPEFLELITRPFVESVPGSAGRFRLADSARAEYMELWTRDAPPGTIPSDLVARSRTLADRFAQVDPLEALRHRLLVEPERALADFRTLFHEAEDGFDLARCQDLLEVLRDRASLAGPAVERVRDEYRRYLDTRGLWLDEFFRTERFVLPEASVRKLNDLIDGTTRTLDLHAPGGYGKTMHVRYLIARRCVPERIPCARIDFDSIDILAATREPHLVLLEAADQLNWQMPGRRYTDLLREYRPLRDRLRRREEAETVRSADAALEGEAATESLGDDIVDGFVRGLRKEAAVLVLDTLEETLVIADPGSNRPAAARLLALLASAQARAPALRLLFSGRYSIKRRVPDLAAPFADLATYDLPKLTRAEARTYLTERREITDDALVAAALAASERVPFNLALIADVIVGEPDIPADEVRALPADQLYLIQRIVNRLKDQQLRWVLRYAALPRRLDLDFIRAVMLPHVEYEMSVRGRDRLTGGGVGDDASWKRTQVENVRLDADAIWHQLRRYVGDSSWISYHPSDPQALQLQPEVVRPMRKLLQGEPTVPLVHADAAKYFVERAQNETSAAPWLKEAVFHRFQLEGRNAAGWWEEQLRAASSPAARQALAEELADEVTFKRDYGSKCVAPATRALARLALAESSLELAVARDVPRDHALFHEAAQALAQLERSRQAETVPAERLALVRAGVRVSQGDVALAGAEVHAAAAGVEPTDSAWLQILYARSLSYQRLTGARATLVQTLAELRPGPQRDHVIRRLIESQADEDDLQAALATLDAAQAEGALRAPEDRLRHARLLHRIGDFAGARRAAEAERDSALQYQAETIQARAELARWRPEQVEGEGEGATISLSPRINAPDSVQVQADRADLAQVAGASQALLLNVAAAREKLARAERLGTDASAFGAVALAHLVEADLSIHGLGHLRAAGVALDKAERLSPAGSEAHLRAGLLRAQLAVRLGDPEMDVLRAFQDEADTPRRRAMFAAAGLATATDGQLEVRAGELAGALDEIQPVSARLLPIYDLAYCERVVRSPALELHAARSWDHELGRLDERDRGVLLVRAADLQRVCGASMDAAVTLRKARELLAGGPAVAARELLRVASRLDDVALTAELASEAIAAARRHEDEYPLLAAAAIIEAAEADPETPEETIELVPQLLDAAGSVGEAWRARLEALRAAQPRRHLEAAAHLQTAADLFEEVGDVLQANAVRERVGAALPTPGGDPALVVTLTLEDDRFVVEHHSPGAHRTTETIQRTPLLDELVAWRRMATRQQYPSKLPDLLVSDVADQQLDRMLGRPPPTPAVRLRVRDAALQLVPWELASGVVAGTEVFYRAPWRPAPNVRTVRTVQAGLNALANARLALDGIAGSATVAALKRSLPDASGVDDPLAVQQLHEQRLASPPHALITRASQRAGEKSMRGSSGEEVLRHYAAGGYSTEVVDGDYATEERLQDVLGSDPPPVLVHVRAAFVPTGGAVALDFGGEWGSAFESAAPLAAMLTTTRLDRVLRAVSPDWPAPVVILEASAPPDDWDAASQLLLRNTFAAELFALGGARAVLATGLATYELEFQLYDMLIGGLTRGEPLGVVVHRLHNSRRAARFAFGASALWCDDPRIRLPARS